VAAVDARVRYVVHELLHDVVGQFPNGDYHTDDGRLNHTAVSAGQNEYFFPRTERVLERRGFAESAYSTRRRCVTEPGQVVDLRVTKPRRVNGNYDSPGSDHWCTD